MARWANHKRAGFSLLLAVALGGTAAAAEPLVKTLAGVSYNRDVRPILADKCFHCHGPDAAARQAELRLDRSEAALADRGGYRVINPGKPELSELIRRIGASDPDERMPPPESGTSLTAGDIETLRRWIAGGAQYQRHWSFLPPQRRRPAPFHLKSPGPGTARPKNAIDRFVLARLARDQLRPAPEADPATLIRRVTLDLTGLPPTLEEVDAFERDARDDLDAAYERLVDRLLASPRYGERMAVGWLDAARYADTNGYFTDNDRTMWPWRDWVINAFNQNMPFDQFTIEQLAGDLLPSPTVSQRIATGFNRNHMVNNETGIIEEEFRVEYVADRVDTTATVWLGLTLGCARCHDHKYDPISQRDFYRFFAFFNNVAERGLGGSQGNVPPVIQVPVPETRSELVRVRSQLAEAQARVAALDERLKQDQLAWEQTAIKTAPLPSQPGLVVHLPLDQPPAAEAVSGDVHFAAGQLGQAAVFQGDGCVQLPGDDVDFQRNDAFSFGAWLYPQGSGCVVSKMDDADQMRGYDVTLRKGKAVVNLVHRWYRDSLRVVTKNNVPSGHWQHLLVTYDGSSRAAGIHVYLNGERQEVSVEHDHLTGSIRNRQPLRIGRRRSSASLTGRVDEVRVYDRQLTEQEVRELFVGQLIRGLVGTPPAARTAAHAARLRAWFLQHHADQELTSASTLLDQLRARQSQLLKNVPTTMVMRDAAQPRTAHLLIRGQYDQPGAAVTAGTPLFLSDRSSSETAAPQPPNRLDLARWLVEPSHPLTARVAVNRLWQQFFGVGIVKTVDDFGTQGAWPSHPDLLDWMAVELVESGWDLKHLVRQIVLSSTYRQSSHLTPELLRRDPENRLLARGPRFRLDAESLRDQALAVSGLLFERLGGPSVKPYQPAGLWEDVTYDSDQGYQPDAGSGLHRRSLYTFWKRQSPPPNMLVFDAPTRETCVVQRSRTNTPLQALVLMNDPTFVEAARKLAERIMTEAKGNSAQRCAEMFRRVTARRPTPGEAAVLQRVFQRQREVYRQTPHDARQLLDLGESSADAALNPIDLAAWTTVANMILSLDETITRP